MCCLAYSVFTRTSMNFALLASSSAFASWGEILARVVAWALKATEVAVAAADGSSVVVVVVVWPRWVARKSITAMAASMLTAIRPRPKLSGPRRAGRPGGWRGSMGLLGPRSLVGWFLFLLMYVLSRVVCPKNIS